ncbi:hypothetical protein WN943_024751 [Citrus x changshan-huyou]
METRVFVIQSSKNREVQLDYLNFDVCDLELTTLRDNTKLRNVLIATENKSILAVEDIDCSINLQGRHSQAKTLNPVNSNAIKPETDYEESDNEE